MAGTREMSFELERFEWAADDRLEVSGRWQGLAGRKLARPVLTVEADGRRRRLTALPGGQLPGKGGEAWRASFAWPHGPADVESAELEIGRNVVVDLPAPRRKKRSGRSGTPARDEGLRAELAELREQIAELRAARGGSPEAEAVAESAEAVAESAEAEPDAVEAAEAELARLRAEHERAGSERAGLREELERADAERAALREQLASLRSEHDALNDQHAALIARSGDLRGQLADAIDAQETLSEELSALEEAKLGSEAERERELAGHREDAEQRLGTERATTTDVREKLASAREEAQKALAAEAAETERIRAELEVAREEAERVVAAERAEVARLREELATRPAPTEEGEAEGDDASRRMYERISRELEHERATARKLRRDLDAKSAETAEQRRSVAAAATNGVHTP